MPIHEYQCRSCDKVIENYVPIKSIPKLTKRARCDCGGEARRILSKTSIHFKGPGWTPKFGEGGSTFVEVVLISLAWLSLALVTWKAIKEDRRPELASGDCVVVTHYECKGDSGEGVE